MMNMDKIFLSKTVGNTKGFSLLEILFGITVFMIGMLGVTALNISSLKSNTFSGNMSEAVVIAGDRLEVLMASKFDGDDLKDTDGDGTDQDGNDDGQDDDGGNFGLDDAGGDADHSDPDIGKNDIYDVYWNVAVGEPLPERTKKVNVIVEWYIKDQKRTMSMSTTVMDHD